MKTLLCTLMLAALGSVAAKADTVTITFDQPSVSASAGDTFQVFGTITNTSGSTVFLNGDSFTLTGFSLSITDQFYTTVPFSLASGESSGDIELFDVTVSNPLLDAPGVYGIGYTVLGGVDGDAQDVVAGPPKSAVSISVTTTAGPSAVPEPASIYLLLGGVPAAFAPMVRRMRVAAKRKR